MVHPPGPPAAALPAPAAPRRRLSTGAGPQAAALIAEVDEDGGGTIGFGEFVQMVHPTPLRALAEGGSVITYKIPLNVLEDTYDHSCYWARSDGYRPLMAASPAAIRAPRP